MHQTKFMPPTSNAIGRSAIITGDHHAPRVGTKECPTPISRKTLGQWQSIRIKVAGTLRVPSASPFDSAGYGIWKMPATFQSDCRKAPAPGSCCSTSPGNLTLAQNQTTDRRVRAFFAPKSEIAETGFDLSINRYKEIVHEEEQYDSPKVIIGRLKKLEAEIAADLEELEGMLG